MQKNLWEGEKVMPFVYGIYELFLIFLFWGFIGWLIEVIDMRIEAGEFQNRGFLHMPFCPIYGIGVAMAAASLNNIKNSYLALFAFGVIFCSVSEYVVGGILERLFHSMWWDYSHMRFNIKGRVCLRNAILFGFGAIVVFRFVEPVVERIITMIPAGARISITMLFSIAFIIDIITSTRRAWTYRKNQEDGKLMLVFKAHR